MKTLTAEIIEKNNKAFHRMSNKRKRIAVAKDVLNQIRSGRYSASPGIYLHIDSLRVDQDMAARADSSVFQKLLLQRLPEGPQCSVCAVGAAFCSMARLGNNARSSDSSLEAAYALFGHEQTRLIENFFELDWWQKYPFASKRLAAIFRNIVRNDGVFKPDAVKKSKAKRK